MISENNERGRNMEKLHIPIVLASDNNQINAMAVVMTSAIKTADENTFYEFYCLLSSNDYLNVKMMYETIVLFK